jgi:hypothetical protein
VITLRSLGQLRDRRLKPTDRNDPTWEISPGRGTNSRSRANGALYAAQPPYTANHPAPSSFYQANIVVETNRSLQLFSGGLSPNVCTDWNRNGQPHTNTDYGGHSYNMGGCMGCHGSQGQSQDGDFSVILARGHVDEPDIPTLFTKTHNATTFRERTLLR